MGSPLLMVSFSTGHRSPWTSCRGFHRLNLWMKTNWPQGRSGTFSPRQPCPPRGSFGSSGPNDDSTKDFLKVSVFARPGKPRVERTQNASSSETEPLQLVPFWTNSKCPKSEPRSFLQNFGCLYQHSGPTVVVVTRYLTTTTVRTKHMGSRKNRSQQLTPTTAIIFFLLLPNIQCFFARTIITNIYFCIITRAVASRKLSFDERKARKHTKKH